MRRRLFIALVYAGGLAAQTIPLDSLRVEGTALSSEFVAEMAGLRIGAPIDKAGIEAACSRLSESGLFASVSFRYAQAPTKGYALTLTVTDQASLSDASIDVPGVDENEAWQWLASQYPTFRRKVPGNDAAQQFLAHKIEDHLGAKLNGQHLVTRMETDLAMQRTLVSFQPQVLPSIASMNFVGAQEFKPDELAALLAKAAAEQGFTERRFRQMVELNLRPAYEKRGRYRVQFPAITVQKTAESAVAVTTTVEDGPQYTLGDVQFVGDGLPVDAMMKAAAFKKGAVANWDEIQHGIWAAERPVRRAGYMRASSRPERVFHEDTRVLDVKVAFTLGPRFRFGKLTLTGLTATQEALARAKWKMQPGDPFDFQYGADFLAEFVRGIAGAPFKKYNVKTSNGAAPNTMDFELVFEAR